MSLLFIQQNFSGQLKFLAPALVCNNPALSA